MRTARGWRLDHQSRATDSLLNTSIVDLTAGMAFDTRQQRRRSGLICFKSDRFVGTVSDKTGYHFE